MSINIDKSFALGFKLSVKRKITSMDVIKKIYTNERELHKMKRDDKWVYHSIGQEE